MIRNGIIFLFFIQSLLIFGQSDFKSWTLIILVYGHLFHLYADLGDFTSAALGVFDTHYFFKG